MHNWIDLTYYIPEDFILRPRALTLTAPNGVGKTTSMSRLVARLSTLNIFDRIYIAYTSHEIGEKICTRLLENGAKRIIVYKGIEKVCINKKHLQKIIELGLNPSFACFTCPYNIFNVYNIRGQNEKIKQSAKIVEDLFKSGKNAIDPSKIRLYNWKLMETICIQPVVKTLAIFPQADSYLRGTIIILCPYAVFASKPIVLSWRKFFKRQRAIRKYLAFFDECDSIIYQGFSYKISKPNFTEFDRKILQKYSTKATKLVQYIDFYCKLYELFEKIAEGEVEHEEGVKLVNELFRKYSKIIKKVDSLTFEISLRAYNENERTFIINSISEISAVEYFTEQMSRTVESREEGIVVQDVDYAYKVLYDVQFPFRYWWKLSTTATFPKPEIFRDSKLIEKARDAVESVETIDIIPENVYVFTFTLFPELFTDIIAQSRNELIEEKVDKVVVLLLKSCELYKSITEQSPNGIILFTGNKHQFNVLKQTFTEIIHEESEGLFKFDMKGIEVYVTYCASKYARGLDFDKLDISIVLAPLIRPPRYGVELDTLDIARAVAESIQSAFRVVRSIRPSRTKLLGFESNILIKKTYVQALPTWFEKLLNQLAISEQFFYIKL